MKVSGEVQAKQLVDLLQWIDYQQKTGILSLTKDEVHHVIYFSYGKIAGTKTNALLPTEGIAQARLILKESLDWKSGHFDFVDEPIPPQVKATNLQMAISPLVDKRVGEVIAPQEDEPLAGNALPSRPSGAAVRSAKAPAIDVHSIIIDRVLTGKFKIPLLPTVATKVMQLTRRENYSLNDLSQVILTDQVIAAHVLKQANSPLFGGEREINTLPLAIQRIGSDTVTKLVFALSLQGVKSGHEIFLQRKKQLWEHSSICALIARFIALPVRLDHNLAFLCGLMQDFGKIVLLSIIQEVVVQETSVHSIADDTVEQILAKYHPMVGSLVGEKWKLPAQVIAAMSSHHTLKAEGEDGQYAAIANLSDAIATHLKELDDDEIATLSEENLEIQVMAAGLAESPANKLLRLNLEQLIAILMRFPDCLTSARELNSAL